MHVHDAGKEQGTEDQRLSTLSHRTLHLTASNTGCTCEQKKHESLNASNGCEIT